MRPMAGLSTVAWFGYFKRPCSRLNKGLFRYPYSIPEVEILKTIISIRLNRGSDILAFIGKSTVPY
jgi:hypothetical protein